MGCRGVTPCPADLFRVRYLGNTNLSVSRKQIGIGVFQRPLLELYSAARRRGDDHRKSAPLMLNQHVDVSDYGLVVAESDRENSTVVIKVITPVSNIALFAAVRFHSRLCKKRRFGASFVPIACSEGVVDPKWFIQLGAKQRYLVSLTHPSLFICLLRRLASPKSYECHAFVCATAEDALAISSLLGSVKEQSNRVGSISPFLEPSYCKSSILSSDLYIEDDTITDVTIPHSPLTLSSEVGYRKSDVLDNQLNSSFSESTCLVSEGKHSSAFVNEKHSAVPSLDVIHRIPQQKRDTMTLSKTLEFGSESEAGWSSKWEPVPPPRRNHNKTRMKDQVRKTTKDISTMTDVQGWEKEELSETLDFSSESELSLDSNLRFRRTRSPPSVTTDSDADYRMQVHRNFRKSFHSETKLPNDSNVIRITPNTQWRNSSSPESQTSYPTRSATLPRMKPKPKAIRWCAEEPGPQRPNFLIALKRFGVRSFSRAKYRTGKLLSSFRAKIQNMKGKEASASSDSAYDTAEVCLSPDGSTSAKKIWKFSNETSDKPNSSQYFVTSEKMESSSGSVIPNRQGGLQRKKKRRHRRRWQPGPRSSSDSGVEEYHSDYSDTLNPMQKSESELEHFASKVSLVSVSHGMTPSEFRQWSKTNMHDELGYIP